MNEQAILDILDRVRNRFYGKYRGTVTDVDPATLRVRAMVPAVLGGQMTGWCTPCVPYAGPGVGIAFLPEAGAGVWIEFEGGDVSYPIWSGCYWREGEAPPEAKPDVKAIVTKSGHKIVIDDMEKKIKITDANDNKITLEASSIKVEHKSQTIELTDSNVKVNGGALEVM